MMRYIHGKELDAKLIEGLILIDTLHPMYTRVKISKKDYRMWFKLNNRTCISILTPVGKTNTATIYKA